MTDWTDAELVAAFRSLDGPAGPGVEFADRLFDDLVGALAQAAVAHSVGERVSPTPAPKDDLKPSVINLTAEARRRRRPDRRLWLLRAAVVAALVAGGGLGITRWRSDRTESITASMRSAIAQLDEHCRSALPSVGSAISDFDAAASSGTGVLNADNLRAVVTAIDQFSAAALVVTAEQDLPSRIRHPFEQAQAMAADAVRALDDGGPDSALRARDAQYAARETLTGALRMAADDGASACRPTW